MPLLKRKSKSFALFLIIAGACLNASAPAPAASDDVQYCAAGTKALQEKDYEKALDLFQKALDLNPECVEGLNGVGLAYTAMGRDYLDKASRSYKKALIIDPRYPEALENEGEYYISQGALKKAYENYQTLQKINAIEAEDLREHLDPVLQQAQEILKTYKPK